MDVVDAIDGDAVEERVRVERRRGRVLRRARRVGAEPLHERLGHLEAARREERPRCRYTARPRPPGGRDLHVERELHAELRLADAQLTGEFGDLLERNAAAEQLVELTRGRLHAARVALLSSSASAE